MDKPTLGKSPAVLKVLSDEPLVPERPGTFSHGCPSPGCHPHSLSCCQGTLLARNIHADRGAHRNPTAATWDLSSWEAPPFDVQAGLQQA